MKFIKIKNKKSFDENRYPNTENNMPLKAPPKEFHVDTKNFKKFCEIKLDKSVKSIDKTSLPQEFSKETIKFIDIFRKKTANEKTEWEFYIDYEKNEIIHCIHGNQTEVK